MSSVLTSRPPLGPTTNDVHRTSSPTATAKTGPLLRHKSSLRGLKSNHDSSEETPSPRSSIYEASLIQSRASAAENVPEWDASYLADTTGDGPPPWENIVVNEAGDVVPISFLQPPSSKKTHVPHELYPITEQSSFATLRSSGSLPMKRSSTSTLRPRSPGLNGKNRKSFSLSDLPPAPPEEAAADPPPNLPQPLQPHQAPPGRIPTPPGLPTFNTPEAINYRLPPPKSRWRDRRFSPSAADIEYRKQTVGLPKGVVMRGENGVFVRGKFTPIRSGHFPPSHARANLLFQALGQDATAGPQERETETARAEPVRLVPISEGADRSMTLLQSEAESRRSRNARRERRLKRIDRFIDFVFCCGLLDMEKPRVGDQGGIDRIADSPRVAPLFVGGFT